MYKRQQGHYISKSLILYSRLTVAVNRVYANTAVQVLSVAISLLFLSDRQLQQKKQYEIFCIMDEKGINVQ